MGIDVTQPKYHLGRIPTSTGKTFPVEILTGDEVRALPAQCSETSSFGIRHRALFILLCRTGLRCGETLALRPKDVDFDVGTVAVLRGKGNRRQTVGEPWASTVARSDSSSLGFDGGACSASPGTRGCSARWEAVRCHRLRCEPRCIGTPSGPASRNGCTRTGRAAPHACELVMEEVAMPIIAGSVTLRWRRPTGTWPTYPAHIAPNDVIETTAKREWGP